jgi:hypothetical protein
MEEVMLTQKSAQNIDLFFQSPVSLESISLPYVIPNKVLLSEGLWNGYFFSAQDISEAFKLTDWHNKKNFELIKDHADKPLSVDSFIGYVRNMKIAGNGEKDSDGNDIPMGSLVGDLELWDKDMVIKLALAKAKFGISAKLKGYEEGTNFRIQSFANFSVVDNPACKSAYINLSDNGMTSELGEKIDRMVKHIKDSLKKKHPEWDDKKIESTAWATVNARIKKMSEEDYIDEDLPEEDIDEEEIIDEDLKEGFVPPEAAQNNAKKVLGWKEKYGDEVKGMTQVGWTRANQLASGKGLSLNTVKRMAMFNRHRKNSEVASEYKDTPWKDRGYLAWLGWGGTSGIDWAISVSESNKDLKQEESDLTLLKGGLNKEQNMESTKEQSEQTLSQVPVAEVPKVEAKLEEAKVDTTALLSTKLEEISAAIKVLSERLDKVETLATKTKELSDKKVEKSVEGHSFKIAKPMTIKELSQVKDGRHSKGILSMAQHLQALQSH